MVDGTSDDIKKVMSEAKRAAQRGGGRKSKQSAMVNTKTSANLHNADTLAYRIVGLMRKHLLKEEAFRVIFHELKT